VVDVTLRGPNGEIPILGAFSDRIYWGISFMTRAVMMRQLATGWAQSLLEDADSLVVNSDGNVVDVVVRDARACRMVSGARNSASASPAIGPESKGFEHERGPK
jgi:hypothetical protein